MRTALWTLGCTLSFCAGMLVPTEPPVDAGPAVSTVAVACADDIVQELGRMDLGDMAVPPLGTIAADCEALGFDDAYVKHVGPAYPACPVEDETRFTCYWDARTRGNGEGESFIHYALEPITG